MSPSRRIRDEGDADARMARVVTTARRPSAIRPIVRRGLSRVEAAAYLGISASKFDELRKANRIAPPKVLDGRLIFTVDGSTNFSTSLPDENQADNGEWTASL